MGRSGALYLALGLAVAPIWGAMAQDVEAPNFWDGFYQGIFAGIRLQTASAEIEQSSGTVGLAAGVGQLTNEQFYYGAEAFLAAQNISGQGDPFLWLEADGRLGARVTKQMLLYTSAGVGYDAAERQLALTGAAGAELALNDGVALRAQYSLAHYPEGGGTVHGGVAGVVLKLN